MKLCGVGIQKTAEVLGAAFRTLQLNKQPYVKSRQGLELTVRIPEVPGAQPKVAQM